MICGIEPACSLNYVYFVLIQVVGAMSCRVGTVIGYLRRGREREREIKKEMREGYKRLSREIGILY